MPAQGFDRKGATTETFSKFRTTREKTETGTGSRGEPTGLIGGGKRELTDCRKIPYRVRQSRAGGANGWSIRCDGGAANGSATPRSLPGTAVNRRFQGPTATLTHSQGELVALPMAIFALSPRPPFRHNPRRCLGPCDPGQQANENSRPPVCLMTVSFFVARGEAAVAIE